MHKRQAVVAALAALCLAGLGACAAPAGPDVQRPTADVPATAAPSPADDAIAAYDGMWRAFGEASQSANWQSPDLGHYATGKALSQLVQSLKVSKASGVETRGTFATNPTVTSTAPAEAPTTARILDCGDDSGTTRVKADTGAPIEGPAGGRHRIEAQVRLVNGTWLVDDFRLREVGSC